MQGAQPKSNEKHIYYATKDKAIQFEKTNYDKIVFFRGTDGHFVAGDHSALILYYLVLPKIKKSLTFRKDNEYHSGETRFRYGFVSIKNVDNYVKKISELPFIKGGYARTEDRIIFTLEEPISKSKIEELANTEELMRDKLMGAISNPSAMPKTYRALHTLCRETYILVSRKCNNIDRALLTNRLQNFAHDSFIDFIAGCRDKNLFEAKMNRICQRLDDLQMEILAEEAAGVWSMSQLHRLAFCASQALQHLKTERKKVTSWKTTSQVSK
ncbi:hypothetical protein IJI69_01630 [Candidatus Saccharibacteria bacterium]|nr:hypothetical protein [Candidatus Saccharibacteria bacterium]